MAKITLTYPDGGLTINIVVKDRDTGTTDFSGVMDEITTGVYKYDFTEETDKDYVYTASSTGYSDMSGVVYRNTTGGLTTEQDEKLTRIYTNTDIKTSSVGSGGWGYSGGVSYSNVENLLKKFFKDFKEEQEEQRQTELELLLKEQDLNEKITRARTEKTQIKLDKQLEVVKQELKNLNEQNKLNKLTTKKGLDEILGKMKQEKVIIKEVKKELEDNRDLLEELLGEDDEDLLEKLLGEEEEEDLLEKLLK